MSSPDITPADLHARIAGGETVEIIDVRTTSEWLACHASGARHVPLSGLDSAAVIASRSGKPDDPLYVICASGGRSAAACAAFRRAGFTQVVNVLGGTSAWAGAGLPVERNVRAAGLGIVKQGAILAAVAGAVLLLMPCSPISVWGSAFCPTAPAGAATGSADTDPAFTASVVEASRTRTVLVQFHATWCGPCQRLAPELAELERERGDRLTVVRVDVDAQPGWARHQGVSSVPDLRLWRDGREVATLSGYHAKDAIAGWIDRSAAPTL